MRLRPKEEEEEEEGDDDDDDDVDGNVDSNGNDEDVVGRHGKESERPSSSSAKNVRSSGGMCG